MVNLGPISVGRVSSSQYKLYKEILKNDMGADAVQRARDRSSWFLAPALWYRRTYNNLAFIHLKAYDVGVSRLSRPKHGRNTNVSTQQQNLARKMLFRHMHRSYLMPFRQV